MSTVRNLLIRIGIDDKRVSVGVANVNRSLDSMASRVEHLEKIARPAQLAALAGTAIQAGRAFAPLTAALGHLAIAAAPAAGALLAIPAALAVGKAAMATFKVGISGVGDALKAAATGDATKFDAAMKKLAPSARQFVTVMAQTRNSFDPIRRAVQQKLFDGLAVQMRGVALNALPSLRSGMGIVATQLNGIAREGLSAARTPLFSGVLARVLGTTATVLSAFRPAVQPLIIGLARLVDIGLPLVRVFGAWLGQMATAGARLLASDRAANAFSRTVDHAIGVFQRNGKAAGAWQNVMAQFRVVWGQLSQIGKNVWSVINAVGRAMQSSTAPSKSLLQLITELTKRMADWANSAQGQKQLSGLFTALQQLASNLVEILPQLGGVLTLILKLINGLPGPVRDTALQMLAWSIVLGRLTGPISGVIKLVGGAGKAIGVLNKVGAGAGKGFAALGKGIGSFGAATGRTAGKFGTAAGNIARTLARVSVNVGRAAASALVSLGRMAAGAAVAIARVVAGWVLMGVQSLLQAARMALAWIIAMGPIAIVIAAVIAIVALIITHWGTVKRVTIEVWNAVWGFIKTVVGAIVGFVKHHWRLIIAIIGGPLGIIVALVTKYWRNIWNFIQTAVRGVIKAVTWLNSLPGKVAGWFADLARGAIRGAKSMLNYVKGIPGRVKGYFSGAGSWLLDAGRAIINGLVNGIKSAVGWLKKNLSWVTSLIPSWKGPLDVDKRLLTPSGAAIMTGLVAGIVSQLPALKRTLANVTAQVGSGVAVPITPTAVTSAPTAQRPAVGAASGGFVGRLQLDVSGANTEFGRAIKKMIRVQGGGDVKIAFGGT